MSFEWTPTKTAQRPPGCTLRGQAERARAANDADSLRSYQRSIFVIFFIFFVACHVLAWSTELTASRHAEGRLAPWEGRTSGDGTEIRRDRSVLIHSVVNSLDVVRTHHPLGRALLIESVRR
jgi:hypothetical protein